MAITRTCVGCRRRDTVDRLVRVVRDESGIRADPPRTAPGRGAYVHPERQCLENAVTRKALARALRVAADVPVIAIADLGDWATTMHDTVTTAKSGVGMNNTQETQR